MSELSDWLAPPADLQLLDADVHVWRAFLDDELARLVSLEATLTEDERARTSSFKFPRDRDRFIVRRGILRSILGRYLRRPASTIEFTYEFAGKPQLRRLADEPPICFSVSHSHGLAMYAFSRNGEVGVDVEATRFGAEVERIAEHFFSATEVAQLRSLPVQKRHEAFLLGWTRKEAYVKAKGTGLGISFDSFEVSLTPDPPRQMSMCNSECWTLFSLRPAEGYAGALVSEGKERLLHLFSFTSSSFAAL
jgi:4'-phosphopantetheinyl transferase